MKNNDGRDRELDQLLKTLKSATPNDLQMKKWKSAVQEKAKKNVETYSISRTKWVLQLVAAMCAGVMIGAVAFKSDNTSALQPNMVAQISLDNATFERSHDNLD